MRIPFREFQIAHGPDGSYTVYGLDESGQLWQRGCDVSCNWRPWEKVPMPEQPHPLIRFMARLRAYRVVRQ